MRHQDGDDEDLEEDEEEQVNTSPDKTPHDQRYGVFIPRVIEHYPGHICQL